MKKHIITLLALVTVSLNFAQISTSAPQITRPNPSVGSILNFNEIPVNTFTGVPDISIPLYGFSTHSKDFNVNLSLNYHSSGVSYHNKAGDVGIGWNLFAGGFISRYIINDPDGNSNTEIINDFNDVYSFNFMGQSGSFRILKDTTNTIFTLKPLDNTTLKIEFEMFPQTQHISAFTIYDDKGYKYVFDIVDIKSGKFPIYYINPQWPNGEIFNTYGSAHFLSKVYDNNGKKLVDLTYTTHILNPGSFMNYKETKILDQIIVTDVGKAKFNYQYFPDLESDKYVDAFQLNELLIETLDGVDIKKYEFTYGGSRRSLLKVKELDKNFVSSKEYNLEYTIGNPSGIESCIEDQLVIGIDGYLTPEHNRYNEGESAYAYVNSSTSIPELVTNGLLKKMILPTGGSIVYDFEPNTHTIHNSIYSEAERNAIYKNENPYNTTKTVYNSGAFSTTTNTTWTFTVTGNANKKLYFSFYAQPYYNTTLHPEPSNEPIFPTYTMTGPNGFSYDFRNGIDDPFYELNYYSCLGKLLDLAPGTYTINVNLLYQTFNTLATGDIIIYEKIDNTPQQKYLYSSGSRIKRITHYDVPNLIQNPQPVRQINYDYRDFNDSNKSSGTQYTYVSPEWISPSLNAVYYHNVKVYDTQNNGYTKYTYFNYMDLIPAYSSPPLLISKFFPYQKGMLKNTSVFDSTNKKLMETESTYDFHYDSYNYLWAAPNTKLVSNYFYINGGTNFNTLQTSETYTYNLNNKQISETAMINSLGESKSTKYYYHSGNSTLSKNRIAEIERVETYRNSELLSTSKVNYSTTWNDNVSYLPSSIATSKDFHPLENRVLFNKYDTYSNPTEIQQQDGTVITYIWGYNKTQPIAKIENSTNAQVVSALGASNFDSITETNMTAINNLRTNSAMSNTMITTFTYNPLIGTTSITDPKGDKITYEYDDFNRLKWVKDKQGNILSENQYEYKVNDQPLNFVKSTTYKIPTQNSIPTPTATQAVINKTFFDGLGRPIQQIAHAQSATGKDIVTHIEYDLLGRKSIDYLPYATTSASLDYNPFAKTELLNYPDYANETPFSEKVFEASPLNRLLKQGAPGNDWAINNNGADHSIKFDYQTNDYFGIKKYTATSTWDVDTSLYTSVFVDGSDYLGGELYLSITKNENWTSGNNNNNNNNNNTTHEYKNKEGRVILKRTFGISDVNGTPQNTNHDTYYVYDQYGNLTYVLPPLADGIIDQQVLDELCYQYKYDSRNRLVEKKIPGKQWEYIVYDKLDRVIATGPSLSPFTDGSSTTYGWTLTKFDAFGRNILTAWSEGRFSSEDRKTLQETYNSTTNPLYETRTTTPTNINNVSFRYTNLSEPTSDYHVLSVNYFDDYDYPNAPTTFSNVMHNATQTVFYNNTTKPKGLATGSWIRILEDSTTLPVKADISYILYDNKARAVRARTNNYLSGYTQVDSKIAFSGRVEYTETKHKRASTDTEIYIREDFSYTNQDRIDKHTHQIGLTGVPQLISKKQYNELGQVISKEVGGDATASVGLQNINYSYNIRGWLTAINSLADLSQDNDPQDLFAFKINYNDVEAEPNYSGKKLYNGNISETYWRSKSDNIIRKYGYEYDDLNRLLSAVYQKPNSAIVVTNSYNESMSYDKNGNITNLERYGDLDTHDYSIKIDELVYTYHPDKKNQLMRVNDNEMHPAGFKDDVTSGIPDITDDYTYDDNGNMTADQNKGITEIKYNFLNLPYEIVFTGTNKKIKYLYNAAGGKVKKIVTDGATFTETDYIGGFQYEKIGTAGSILKFFPHAEGYVNATLKHSGYAYNYVFNYTDHLGNIRMSYTWDTELGEPRILEENHYYPYGLKHEKYNADKWEFVSTKINSYVTGIAIVTTDRVPYQYKYNGKEYQDELGLNMYDYGARNYDPALGRWMNIDPLAEISRRWSPYSYTYNNPLRFIDPDGKRAVDNVMNDEVKEEKVDYKALTEQKMEDIKISNEINEGFKKYIESVEQKKSPPHGVGYSFFNKAGLLWSPTFYGVPIRLMPNVTGGAASYFGNAINISMEAWSEFLEKGIDSNIGNLIMHEFGHYLQEQYLGVIKYNTIVAPGSLADFQASTYDEHQQYWAEKQASTLAYYYFGQPKNFNRPLDKTSVNQDYLDKIKNQYLNHPDY